MKTVYTDCLHRMQPLDWLPIFLGERDVSPNVPNRAARFHSTYHVAFRQVLVFQAYCRLDKDSSFFQHPQRLPREFESELVQPSLLLHANNILLFLCGMPSANRTTKGSANHLFGAASPTLVKAWIFDQDGQVVAAPVVPTVSARRTACDVIPANLPRRPHVLQNAKFRAGTSVFSLI